MINKIDLWENQSVLYVVDSQIIFLDCKTGITNFHSLEEILNKHVVKIYEYLRLRVIVFNSLLNLIF